MNNELARTELLWKKLLSLIGSFFYLDYFYPMKKQVYKLLAKINKLLLPSYTKKQLDMGKATKAQLAIIGWRYLITKNALD